MNYVYILYREYKLITMNSSINVIIDSYANIQNIQTHAYFSTLDLHFLKLQVKFIFIVIYIILL